MFHFSFFYSDKSSFLYEEIEEKFFYIESKICEDYGEYLLNFSFYKFKDENVDLNNAFSDICIEYADYDLICIFNLDYLFISKKDIDKILKNIIIKKESFNLPFVFSKWKKGERSTISRENNDSFSSLSYVDIANSDKYLMKEMYSIFKSSEMNILHIVFQISNCLFSKMNNSIVCNFSKDFSPTNKYCCEPIKSNNIENICMGKDFEINKITKKEVYDFMKNLISNNELEKYSHIVIDGANLEHGNELFSGRVFCSTENILKEIVK